MNVADGLLRWPTARGQQSRAEQGKAGQGLLSDSANERGEAAVEGARDCAQCAGGEKLQSSRALSLSLCLILASALPIQLLDQPTPAACAT